MSLLFLENNKDTNEVKKESQESLENVSNWLQFFPFMINKSKK